MPMEVSSLATPGGAVMAHPLAHRPCRPPAPSTTMCSRLLPASASCSLVKTAWSTRSSSRRGSAAAAAGRQQQQQRGLLTAAAAAAQATDAAPRDEAAPPTAQGDSSSSSSSSAGAEAEAAAGWEAEAVVDGVAVHRARTTHQLRQTAALRADAYYEEQPQSRFVDTFKRQFMEQELASLLARTSPHGRPGDGAGGRQPCVCLVAVDAASGDVLGCADVRPPAAATGGRMPKGVPGDDALGAYMLNVVVAEGARGRGLGKRLIAASAALAAREWGAQRLYTHVDAQNDVAHGLYVACGFEASDDGGTVGAGGTDVGRQICMVKPV